MNAFIEHLPRQTFFSRCFTVDISEYIEDLCPYATFQLNKQTYSESSYSGNVYSGPYHSVRGSFVYHENKNDSYRVNSYHNLKFHFNNFPIFKLRAKNQNTRKFVELDRVFVTQIHKMFSSLNPTIPEALTQKFVKFSPSTFQSPNMILSALKVTTNVLQSP